MSPLIKTLMKFAQTRQGRKQIAEVQRQLTSRRKPR